MRILRALVISILTLVVFCIVQPSLAANETTHPDDSNTGPTGTLQAQSGNQTLGDGQTFQNINLTGCITVTGSNVTIKNSKITCGGGTAAILLNTAGTHDITIDHVTATMPAGQGVGVYLGAVSTVMISAVNMSNAGDIIMLNNPNSVTIKDSWLHDPQLGGHVDVIQVVGGKNITIQNNALKLTTGTAAGGNGFVGNVIAKADLGVIDNLTIDNNFSQGGSVPYYCMAGNDPQNSNSAGQFAAPTNCHITNNTILAGSFTYQVPIIVNQAAGELINCNKLTDGSLAKVARNDRGGGIFTSTCSGGTTPTVSNTQVPSCATKAQGDADCNGTITLTDYQLWKNGFTGTDTTNKADFNSDGKVTLVDYATWRTTFLGSSGGVTPTISSSPQGGQSFLGSFWKQFSRGPDPQGTGNYVGIGVWWQEAVDAQKYKDIGINTYIVPICPNESEMAQYRQAGMKLFIGIDCPASSDPLVIGATSADEPDLTNVSPSQIISTHAAFRQKDSTRPIYINFTRGVYEDGYASCGQVTCGMQAGNDYDKYIGASDVVSTDLYPIASGEPLENVSLAVVNLVQRTQNKKPVWNYIETTGVQHGQWYSGRAPTPDEMESEVWMSIVNGATGYVFFAHDFSVPSQPFLSRQDMMQKAKVVNALVQSLSGVINNPTITPPFTISGGSTKIMVKQYQNTYYVFAVNMSGQSTQLSMSGLPSSSLQELRTNTTKQVSGQSFNETIEGYGARIYKLQ